MSRSVRNHETNKNTVIITILKGLASEQINSAMLPGTANMEGIPSGQYRTVCFSLSSSGIFSQTNKCFRPLWDVVFKLKSIWFQLPLIPLRQLAEHLLQVIRATNGQLRAHKLNVKFVHLIADYKTNLLNICLKVKHGL